jgi:hypothetical protein
MGIIRNVRESWNYIGILLRLLTDEKFQPRGKQPNTIQNIKFSKLTSIHRNQPETQSKKPEAILIQSI